jgi:Sigma-70, region 4
MSVAASSAAAASAGLQLPTIWAVSLEPSVKPVAEVRRPKPMRTERVEREPLPPISLAFYRKHTESMLRRYLYASMQVGRAPSILSDPVARGWASSRPIRTFEDAVIFVLDVERCLERLSPLDRQMLSRVVLQEYTQAEAATILGMSPRTMSYKFPQALDRLTEKLPEANLLLLPH